MIPMLLAGVLAGAAPLAIAQSGADKNLADAYFSAHNPVLTPQEKAAVAIAKRWRDASATGIKPVAGPDGSVRYLYGAQQPSIVCAVLQVCDVELQAGE